MNNYKRPESNVNSGFEGNISTDGTITGMDTECKAERYTRPAFVALSAVACCLLWGSAFPCIKIGYGLLAIDGEDAISQILFAGYRFTIAGIMVIVIGSIMQRRFLKPDRKSLPLAIKLGMVQTVLQYLFFYLGLAHTSGVRGSIITASNVFISIFLSALVFGERLTIRKLVGCGIGFAGVVAINLGGDLGGAVSLGGEGFMLIAAGAAALSSVLIKKYSEFEDTFTLCGYQFFIGGIILIAAGLAGGGHVSGFTPASISLLCYLGLVSSVAYSLWSFLLKHNPVGRVAVFGFSNPVFGVLLSAVLLGEKNQAFTLSGLSALILVCIGITLAQTDGRNRRLTD